MSFEHHLEVKHHDFDLSRSDNEFLRYFGHVVNRYHVYLKYSAVQTMGRDPVVIPVH